MHKFIKISHRGNLSGKNTAPHGENHPTSIKNAIDRGYFCEIDVRLIDNKFYLGHDKPEYEVDELFFNNYYLFVHCKNIEAFYKLVSHPAIEAFYHDTDDVVITSTSKYFWSYPKSSVLLTDRSIAVLPELVPEWDVSGVIGICSDYIEEY